jgi:hypothetical protein
VFYSDTERCLPPHAEILSPREVLQTLRPEEWERQERIPEPFCLLLHSNERNAADSHRELSRLPLILR